MSEPRLECPHCGGDGDKVKNTRPNASGTLIRRRRQCRKCHRRYSTEERIIPPNRIDKSRTYNL